MARREKIYLRQKPVLYFDENFPRQVIEAAQNSGPIKNHFKICSVFDFGHQRRDDPFHLGFCKSRGFVLVTLDTDFMDDRKYPIQNLPGIIVVAAPKNDAAKILACLTALADFLANMPFPKNFMRDSKFQVSAEGCIMRGRHVRTKHIKTIIVRPGNTIHEIAKAFGLSD